MSDPSLFERDVGKKKDHSKKKKASSSDGDESSSKGASKSKKKKLSKMGRLHQELQALKEEVSVKTTEKEEFQKELRSKFEKREAHLVDDESVLYNYIYTREGSPHHARRTCLRS